MLETHPGIPGEREQMNMNALVSAYVRQTLELERDEIFQTGSRVIGAGNPDSDYDFVVRVTPDTVDSLRNKLCYLGEVQPFTQKTTQCYGEIESILSTTCFYVKSPEAGAVLNILLKQEIQFAAWRHATERLCVESFIDAELVTSRAHRVARFIDWRTAYALGAWYGRMPVSV